MNRARAIHRARLMAIGLMLGLAVVLSLGFTDADTEAFTAEVIRSDLKIEVELTGTFVAENKDEIRIEPEAYSGELIITRLATEGAAVKTGDVLMEFDPSSLERSLEDARNEVSDKTVALDKATADLRSFEVERRTKRAQNQMELTLAERELGKARDQAAWELADKEKSIKDAVDRLTDARVDFEQLTQLYEERELHTATENILIDRERRRIADLERTLDKTRSEVEIWKKYDQTKTIDEKQLEVDKKNAEIEKAEIQLDAEFKEKEAEVAKAQRALDKAEREVSELEADADSLLVVAPRDGIVFYGTIGDDDPFGGVVFISGQRNSEMRIGGRVRTHQILMTVASMDRLAVSMKVLENDIQHMKAGLPITIRPDAFPSLVMDGQLTKVDQVANRTGLFSEVREFTVKGSYEEIYEQLRSGMNCRVTVHADTVPDTLQVPVLAVFAEGGSFHCLVRQGGSVVKRPVKLGATNGSMVEITEGLRAGETVSLWNPSGD
ncbi:MAG: efflux RND transporter periplasmic adaptor subunit [Planctomycetota bacterium]|jgi:multidrug efflux pump subunit AcrA (membrane-fusion protein)